MSYEEEDSFDIENNLVPFEDVNDLPKDVVYDLPGKQVAQKLEKYSQIWISEETTQNKVDNYKLFVESTVLGMDRLIHEISKLRQILAEEAAKPVKGEKLSTRGRHKRSDEETCQFLIETTLKKVFSEANTKGDFLDELETDYFIKTFAEAFIQPMMRFSTIKLQEFIESTDDSKYRDNDTCIKLAKAISDLEKTRSTLEVQMSKSKIEARVGAIISQLISVLSRKIRDKGLLAEVCQGIEELIKTEDMEIEWGM